MAEMNGFANRRVKKESGEKAPTGGKQAGGDREPGKGTVQKELAKKKVTGRTRGTGRARKRREQGSGGEAMPQGRAGVGCQLMQCRETQEKCEGSGGGGEARGRRPGVAERQLRGGEARRSRKRRRGRKRQKR